MAMHSTLLTLDRYIVDTLMPDLVGQDRRPAAFLVYLALVAATHDRQMLLSHARLAESTGLSKRSVQDAIATLVRRGLIARARGAPTEAARYRVLRPWRDRATSGGIAHRPGADRPA